MAQASSFGLILHVYFLTLAQIAQPLFQVEFELGQLVAFFEFVVVLLQVFGQYFQHQGIALHSVVDLVKKGNLLGFKGCVMGFKNLQSSLFFFQRGNGISAGLLKFSDA